MSTETEQVLRQKLTDAERVIGQQALALEHYSRREEELQQTLWAIRDEVTKRVR